MPVDAVCFCAESGGLRLAALAGVKRCEQLTDDGGALRVRAGRFAKDDPKQVGMEKRVKIRSQGSRCRCFSISGPRYSRCIVTQSKGRNGGFPGDNMSLDKVQNL